MTTDSVLYANSVAVSDIKVVKDNKLYCIRVAHPNGVSSTFLGDSY